MERKVMITGNWKMHKTIEEARQFIKEFLAHSKNSSVLTGLAVPFTSLYPLSQEVKEVSLLIGAQNMNDASEGAFTGEIAGKMLVEAGARFVLLGHSERRHLYHESNEWINRKVKRAIEVGLQPVLCVGETLEEHDQQQAREVIAHQLREGLKEIEAHQLKNLVIAYEPIWAIGTGQSATPELAQEMHHFCRQILAELTSETQAQETIIQYGGSVHPSNAQELLAEPDIDGLLIGGASLSLESFTQIVNDSHSRI